MIMLCATMATIMFFGLRLENQKRDLGKRDYRFNESESELMNMGDDHPNFRFST